MLSSVTVRYRSVYEYDFTSHLIKVTGNSTSKPRELHCTSHELNRVRADGGIVVAKRAKCAFDHSLPTVTYLMIILVVMYIIY